jgi:hypothetical protein
MPLLPTKTLAATLANIVLKSRLSKRKMTQFHRFDDAIHNECRPEASTQAEKQHLSALVTAEGLHRCVVDQLRRLAERALEVEPDPSQTEVHRLGHDMTSMNNCGTPTDATSYDQSSVSAFTRSTIRRGASSGPDGKRRGSLAPDETSSLTYEPPTSTARTFMDGTAFMSLFWR